jgi:plasmid maintenance system killer protein
MIIRSVRHRGLLRLIRDDDSRELRSDLVPRVRRVLTALITATDMQALHGPSGRRAGGFISFKVIAPERGTFRSAAIGG